MLKHLKESGNPYYQFCNNSKDYEERCKKSDEEGHQLIFGKNTQMDEDTNIYRNNENTIMDEDTNV